MSESPAADPPSRHVCPECLEPIPGEARLCPECGASQRPPTPAGRVLRAVPGVVALVTVVLGLHQLTNVAVHRFERGSAADLNLAVVGELLRFEDYRTAWRQLDDFDSPDERVKRMRERVAAAWIVDAHGLTLPSGIGRNGLDITLGEIANRVIPVLAEAADSPDPRRRADFQALLAYAQITKSRDEPLLTDIGPLFREALAQDDTSALAHLLYARYLHWNDGDIDEIVTHLDRAVQLAEGDPDLSFTVRNLQFSMLRGEMYGTDTDQASRDRAAAARVALVRFAHDALTKGSWTEQDMMRTDAERMQSEPDYYWEQMTWVYRLASESELRGLVDALPPEQHLAVLEWVVPTPASAQKCTYLKALLHLELGDTTAAVAALESLEPNFYADDWYDALHEQLTGEPVTPLSQRDPWAYRTAVLGGRIEATAEERAEALEEVDRFMEDHRRGTHAWDEQLEQAVSAALRADDLPVQPGGEGATELRRRLTLYSGELARARDRAAEAVNVLRGLVDELPPGHPLRGRALVELATAVVVADPHAQERCVDYLTEAVEKEGWSDWAVVRWRAAFDPLHERRDYAGLLARHGRRAGPPAGVEIPDDG